MSLLSRSASLVAVLSSLTLSSACPMQGQTNADGGGTSGADVYTAGMEKPGEQGRFRVQLVEAQPGPPDRGDNVWTLAVNDEAGMPVSDAVVELHPYMPQHGHGTTPPDYTAAAQGDGTYVAGPFDLFMPGLWEVTVDITGSDGTEDRAVFAFDIEG